MFGVSLTSYIVMAAVRIHTHAYVRARVHVYPFGEMGTYMENASLGIQTRPSDYISYRDRRVVSRLPSSYFVLKTGCRKIIDTNFGVVSGNSKVGKEVIVNKGARQGDLLYELRNDFSRIFSS